MLFVTLSTLNCALAFYFMFKSIGYFFYVVYVKLQRILVNANVRPWLAYVFSIVLLSAATSAILFAGVQYLRFTLPIILKVLL